MYLQNNTLLQGGKYKIVRFLSSGGFGNTYEGVHTLMDNRVAIKEFFVKDYCERDEESSLVTVVTRSKKDLVEKFRMKFIEEAKAIFKMKHSNIVHVLDIFEENGTSYYVMEYIDGSSLNDIIKQNGALSEEKALKYMLQVCDALKYVHSLNRLHLDVKPGNIMIDSNDNAILIDFGASKHYSEATGDSTTTMQGLNTPGYAPIEQTVGGITTFTPASDIYAVGATLYKLLTGVTPVSPPLRASGEELAPLPKVVSESVRNAVEKAMALRKIDRYQRIEDLVQALEVEKENDSVPQVEKIVPIANSNDEHTVIADHEEIPSYKTEQLDVKISDEQYKKWKEFIKDNIFEDGVLPYSVIKDLVRRGAPEVVAKRLVIEVLQEGKEKGKKLIRYGIGVCFVPFLTALTGNGAIVFIAFVLCLAVCFCLVIKGLGYTQSSKKLDY